MHDYKLIAIDLDGTLLNDQNQVSDENLQAICELKKRGVFFVPCTGRTLAEIPSAVKDNPNIRYIIHSNGAVLLDKQTNNKINCCISNTTAKCIFDILSHLKGHVTIRHDGKCYTKAGTIDKKSMEFYNIIPAHEDVLLNYATYIENFEEWLANLDNIEVISVFFHSLAELATCRKALSKIEEIRVVSAAEFNLEILSKKAGKGAGLESLCELLNIDKNMVIGVGDSGNDLPMMQSAGIKVAVSNAVSVLKEVCDEIICSNNENVVDYILKNF